MAFKGYMSMGHHDLGDSEKYAHKCIDCHTEPKKKERCETKLKGFQASPLIKNLDLQHSLLDVQSTHPTHFVPTDLRCTHYIVWI